MYGSKGIALVSALSVSAVILVFGLGSIYLSNMTENIAVGQRSAAIARSSAEAGLQIARLALSESFSSSTPKQLPTSMTLPTSPDSNISYTLVNYTPATDATSGLRTQAQVVVQGSGLRGGRYRVEALIGIPSSGGQPKSVFYSGLIAEGTVTNSGGIAPMVDTKIHGNLGFDVEASMQNCTSRDASGSCTSAAYVVGTLPITAATGMATTCKATLNPASSICSSTTTPIGSNLSAAVTLDDPLTQYTTLSSAITAQCTSYVASLPPSPSGVVCVSGSVNISGLNLSNATIVATGDITSSGGATTNNLTLVSTTGKITMSGGNTITNTRLFSQGVLTLSGGTTVTGKSTVASATSVTMSGGTDQLGVAAGGKSRVGLAIISAGAVTLSGGSTTYASVFAGGKVTFSGGSVLRGGIATKGNIVLSGGANVDANVVVENDDLPSEATGGLIVLSRR